MEEFYRNLLQGKYNSPTYLLACSHYNYRLVSALCYDFMLLSNILEGKFVEKKDFDQNYFQVQFFVSLTDIKLKFLSEKVQ